LHNKFYQELKGLNHATQSFSKSEDTGRAI
jgi:hypothetical protein